MDVFLVRQPLAEGETEAARELFSRLDESPPAGVTDVLRAETVHTETAFLERREDGDYVCYYIEAEDGATVRDVFEGLLADPASAVDAGDELGEFVEAFQSVVAGPPELVAAERLYHLVDPDRSGGEE